eukprot:7239764-Lingulodinium_polyedra.AAC.1
MDSWRSPDVRTNALDAGWCTLCACVPPPVAGTGATAPAPPGVQLAPRGPPRSDLPRLLGIVQTAWMSRWMPVHSMSACGR